MTRSWPSPVRRYAVAVLATTLGVLLKEALGPQIVPSVYLTAYAAVLASAAYGGFGPGVLATILSALIDWDLFLPPIFSLNGFDAVTAARVALFTATCVPMSWFVDRWRTNRARLVTSEARLRRMFEADLVGMITYHLDGTIREANDRFLQMVGYTRADVRAGRLWWSKMTPSEYASRDAAAIDQIAASGTWVPFEKEYLRQDGSRVPVIVAGGATDAARQEGVAFVFDITERKQAEQALRVANVELERRVAERTAKLQTELAARRQIETALRESEERFHSAFRHTPIGMALVNLEGVPFQVNHALCEMLGYTEAELLATNAEVLTHPDDIATEREHARRLLAGEIESCQFEKRYLHKQGHVIWASLSASLLRDAAGQPLHYISQVEDVTERRRLYDQLRDSEQRFSNGFKYAPIGMALVGIDGVVMQVNQALCDMLGYSEAELLARRSFEVTHPDDLTNTIEQLYKMVAGETDTWQLERRYFHKDGHIVWGESSTSMVRDERGNSLYVISQVRDVTEQRLATERLRQSEERFALAVNGASDGIWDWCLDTDTVYLSPRCRVMAGMESDADTSPSHWASHVFPDDRERVATAVSEHLDGRTPHFECEYRIEQEPGMYRWVLSRGLAVRDATGKAYRMAGSLTDVSDRKRAELTLRESEERFHSAFRDAPAGMALIDRNGQTVRVNRALCAILGYSEPELLAMSLSRLMHSEDVAHAQDGVRRIERGELESHQSEGRYVHKSGRVVWAEIGVSLIRDRDGRPLHSLVHVRDITDRHYLSRVLAALNARLDVKESFREVASNLQGMTGCYSSTLILFDEHNEWGTVWPLDPSRSERPLGARMPIRDSPALPFVVRGRAHLVPDLAAELSYAPLAAAYRAGIRSAMTLPLAGADRVAGMLVLVWTRVDACEAALVPAVRQVADALALAMEKHRLFEQVDASRERLQALSRELLRVQEAERRHLAVELHDEIGQTLTGIRLMLGTINRVPAATASARLQQTLTLVDDLVAQVRNLSLELRPAMLDDLGLLPALLWLLGRYTDQTKIEIAFEHHGLDRRLPSEIETAAFRIIQEALTNIARHANTTEARVKAQMTGSALLIQVTDAGSGFDLHGRPVVGATTGLAGMRERALLLGGRLTVESTPGEGTCVQAELPLAMERNGDERHDFHRG